MVPVDYEIITISFLNKNIQRGKCCFTIENNIQIKNEMCLF